LLVQEIGSQLACIEHKTYDKHGIVLRIPRPGRRAQAQRSYDLVSSR
jgi:hypothetical protein